MATAVLPDNKASSEPSQRYHDLDAFRAWAVLLGIVLHVAWLMMPYRLATPIVDNDHHPAAAWLFTFIHFFRMQAFFLVAGFFANLVYSKRGLSSFAKNRALRIGVPLVVGALIMVPWMRFYHAWGGVVGGATLTSDSLMTLWIADLKTTLSNNIPLIHLWFLYDLLLLYVITLAIKLPMDVAIDRDQRIRRSIQQQFIRIIRSPANILWLSFPSAVLLLPMKYWIGIEGYPTWLIPDWYGFLGYWIFFGVGWMLYVNRELLPVFSIRWKTNLLLGVLLSFPIWGFYENYVRVDVNGAFPALTESAIVDYSAIRKQLLSASPDTTTLGGPRAEATREIWQRLSPQWQERIARESALHVNPMQGFATELTVKVVFGEPLAMADRLAISKEDLDSARNVTEQNRLALGTVFSPSITDKLKHTPQVWALKTTFSVFYAITMWLLVFGFMGLFQTHCKNPSPAARYLSDSSYWLYLLHLPLLFWLAMYLTPIQLGFLGKFAAYNLLAVLILLPSYHYLVRSTPLGSLLNGRRYPFRGFFDSDLFDRPDNSNASQFAQPEHVGARGPSDEPDACPSIAKDLAQELESKQRRVSENTTI